MVFARTDSSYLSPHQIGGAPSRRYDIHTNILRAPTSAQDLSKTVNGSSWPWLAARCNGRSFQRFDSISAPNCGRTRTVMVCSARTRNVGEACIVRMIGLAPRSHCLRPIPVLAGRPNKVGSCKSVDRATTLATIAVRPQKVAGGHHYCWAGQRV